MILLFRQIIVLISVLALSSCERINSSDCNKFCGRNSVPYPFGFSDGCKIKLNCSSSISGIMWIGNFSVQNVTSNHILINLPAKCNRSIEELFHLYGPNFAPTWRNVFLLGSCIKSTSDCVNPSRLIGSSINLESCDSAGRNHDYNVSCYSSGFNDFDEFFDYDKIGGKGNCSVLSSSVMVDLTGNSSSLHRSNMVELNFQTAELGWWLDGKCECDSNASCTTVSYKGHMGYRCKCNQGFVGDGFSGGQRCRDIPASVSHCKASYVSTGCGGAKVGILTGGIVGGAFMVATLALICYCMKRPATPLNSQLSAKRLIAGNSSVPFYSYKEIERATNSFCEKKRLGTGAYGTVYAGKLHNGECVAIKKIRHRDHESVYQVMNEIKLLSSVSHPNLVRLLGCCIENGEQILVYEYMPNGTLCQHLQRERGSVLPWNTRLTIAAETANAIAHLHSAMNPPIYHRDIKSSNILLDYNFKSRVADFGLCRFGMTDDSHVSTAPQGTPGYVDPQYHQNFHLSDKSDVYSFGVVLVEIITAMKVVDFSRPHSEINLAALAIDRIGKGLVDEIIDPFLDPNTDAWALSSIHKVAELAFRCLAFHRDMRPSMIEVAGELEQIRISCWAPMDENIHMGSLVVSSCSSPYQRSEKSFNISLSKKMTGVGSRRVAVPQGVGQVMEEVEGCLPVSVQDSWLSENSSPSSKSLLGKN